MLLQDGLKMWGEHSETGSGGTMACFENLRGHVLGKPHALNDICKNLIVVTVFKDEATNHGIESIVAIHKDVDG